MNRRDFLRLLLVSTAAEFVDYEKLLWVPGEKKIFIPSVLPISLYGVPYHQSDGSTGLWMGLVREKLSPDDLAKITWKGFEK